MNQKIQSFQHFIHNHLIPYMFHPWPHHLRQKLKCGLQSTKILLETASNVVTHAKAISTQSHGKLNVTCVVGASVHPLFHQYRKTTQGHPTTVFCKISVRRSKYCLASFAWGRLKISRWTFHLCTAFEAYLINSLRFSKVWFFIFYWPVYTTFCRKGNLKFSDSKMWWTDESQKC